MGARKHLEVQPPASHFIPLGLSFPACYVGRRCSAVLGRLPNPGSPHHPSPNPSPRRPRRVTRLESHRHGPPGGSPAPLPEAGPGNSQSAPTPGWGRRLGRVTASEGLAALVLLPPAPQLPAAPAPSSSSRSQASPAPAQTRPLDAAEVSPPSHHRSQVLRRKLQAGLSTQPSWGRRPRPDPGPTRLPARPGRSNPCSWNGAYYLDGVSVREMGTF